MELDEFTKVHVVEPFDRASETYDRGRMGWYRGILSLLGGRASPPLLDAGCGTGYVACRLAERGLDTLVCLDVSRGMLKVVQRRARKWRVDASIHPVRGTVTMLPFRSNAFSTVLAAAVVHHVYGRERRVEAIRELERVCRGFLLLTVWSALSPGNLLTVIAAGSRDVLLKRGGTARYYHLYTRWELARDLRAAGCEGFRLYAWDYKPVLLKRNLVVELECSD
ncbi:MAG: methyltransferase domain-containing protein [Thermofilaceae archaeon]